MNSGYRVGAMLVTSVLLTGCAKVRYPTNYVLNLGPRVHRIADHQVPLGPVVIRQFRCPDYLCQDRIVYRPSPEEVGYYEYHRWAADPRQLITMHFGDALRAENVFAQVTTNERDIRPAYIFSGSIDRLEEIDDARQVRVVCALSAQLVDAESGAVVWTGAASENIPIGERNVAGVVRSLSAAAQAAVNALTQSLAGQMRSHRSVSYSEVQPRTSPGER